MEPTAGAENALPQVSPKHPPITSIPTTIGILNIVFGSVLLACAFCSGLNLLLQSVMLGPMMAVQQQQVQQQLEAERAQRLARLKAEEEAAANEKEKAAVRARQKAVEAQPIPKMPNFGKIAEDPTLQGYTITDVITATILNVLMLFSGIALLNRREWGRVTAIWVAILKIVRLVALYTFYALVIVPDMVANFNAMFQEMFEEIGKGAPPGAKVPGPAELAQMSTVMGMAMTATAVIMILIGAIYPVVVLITLTRQRVKDACALPAKPG